MSASIATDPTVRGADRADDGDYQWVEGPEREPCMLCYTSGTTGNPKGVLYEHRSSVIHAMAEVAPSCFDLVAELGRAADRADVPRRRLGPALRRARWRGSSSSIRRSTIPVVLCKLMNEEKVTHSAGVPTVWLAMFQHMDATGDEARASADRHHRRLGRAARDDRAADEDGDPRRPRLGHDRDLADRHDRARRRPIGTR